MQRNERIARMASRIAAEEDDIPLKNVDEAIDNMIAALTVLDENLPLVGTDNVPQKAALDNIQELLEEAIKPYLADIVRHLEIFGT